MSTVREIEAFIARLAPKELAYSWDNCGLLLGSPRQEVKKVLVALDLFEDVADEAIEVGADLIVTHHPLIFDPLRQITDDTATGRTVMKLIAHNISAVNAHTNLDIAPGGVNDCLADILGLSDVQVIGSQGLLRMGLTCDKNLHTFLARVKNTLGVPALRYAGKSTLCHRVAVGGGACGSDWAVACEHGCDTFVTADVKYNQFRDAYDAGLTIIDAGHFHTEHPVCAYLSEKLAAAFPEIQVIRSVKNRDCMKFFD